MPLWKKPEKQSLVLIAYDVDSGEKKAEFYCDKGRVISESIFKLNPSIPQKTSKITIFNFFI